MKSGIIGGACRFAVVVVLAVAVPAAVLYADEWLEKEKKIRENLMNDMKIVEKIDKGLETLKPELRIGVMRIFNISDLISEVPDFCNPSPAIRSPEHYFEVMGASDFEDDYEPWLDPESLIEIIQATTGEDNWPEEEGFGTISYHRGKIISVNTEEIQKKIGEILEDQRIARNVSIATEFHLIGIPEERLEQYRGKKKSENYALIDTAAARKLLTDAKAGEDVRLLQSARLVVMNRQRGQIFSGSQQTYLADQDVTGGGIGTVTKEASDPSTFVLHTGMFVEARATGQNKEDTPVHISVRIAVTKLKKFHKLETSAGSIQMPEVDMQITNGDLKIPAGSAALLGGARSTVTGNGTQAMVLVIPRILGQK
ncbi:MAG: hypothetical protein ACYS8W_11795 [Planctomycetota bacterium]|jgi:hypothetical protein